MSTSKDWGRCCMRAARTLMIAMLVAASATVLTESAAGEFVNATDAGISSFSGYMVAVG